MVEPQSSEIQMRMPETSPPEFTVDAINADAATHAGLGEYEHAARALEDPPAAAALDGPVRELIARWRSHCGPVTP